MSKLFECTVLNGMELPNRFIRSATWEGMANVDGSVTPRLIETLVSLVKGGVGLIITSHAYVLPEGQAAPWQLGVYKDELVEGLQKLTAAVHASGAKIAMQVSHGGNFALEPFQIASPGGEPRLHPRNRCCVCRCGPKGQRRRF
jgi:2,4-dienoyl-CoA reductase-like NADH-dependent reductase (Old Yellow Enzyme family)